MNTYNSLIREMKRLKAMYNHAKENFKGRRVNRHLNIVRELAFVRAISALEIFLIDSIKEIFTVTKRPFKIYEGSLEMKNNRILSASSLSQLHTDIINKICRNLSNNGYNEIEKFYYKYFNINLAETSVKIPLDIKKCYEDRHLLVHKVGFTDKDYRRKYDTNKKQIQIDEEYLKQTLWKFRQFGLEISKKLEKEIESLKVEETKKPQRKIKLSILKIEEKSDILNRKFSFWLNDEFIDINDLLLEYSKIESDFFEICIGGDIEKVSKLLKKIKSEKKKGIIDYLINEDYLDSEIIRKTKRVNLSKDQIEKIQLKLSPQPWPKGIHKKIAIDLGLSNGQVSAVINHLIREGVFKNQIDGKIIEEDTKNLNQNAYTAPSS